MNKREHFRIATVVGCVCILGFFPNVVVHGSSYGDAIGKSIISAVIAHDEQKYWKPVAYPTDNFGLGTLYDGKGADNLLCATAKCLGLKDNSTETLKGASYIESGRGGSIKLDDTQKKALGFNIVAKLISILSLNGKLDTSKAAVVSVDVPGATIRYLVKGTLTDHIKASPATAQIKDAYENRRLRAIVGDIVVDSFSASVKLDDSVSAEVKTTLDANAGKLFDKDTGLGVTYSKIGAGTYVVKTLSPVIVAVELAQQPKTGVLSTGEASWPPDTTLRIKTDQP